MNTISMDFGTYNSAVAYRLPNGEVILLRPPLITTSPNSPIIPSFLKFTSDGEFESFGEPAKNAAATDPQHVVWGLKRLLGLSYRDAHERGELARFHYRVMDAGGKLLIEIGRRLYTPIDLVKLFLKKVKESCESPTANLPLGGELEKLILTRPAYFDDQQTTSLKEAALGAGYQTVELIREPEAAAIAYKDLIDFSREPLVMVIDWGAGTLDFFIAHFFLEDGRPKIAPTTPAFGDTRSGGIDMDDALLQRVKDVHKLRGLDWRDDARLRVEIEKAKIRLSETEFTKRFFAAEGAQLALNFVRSRQVLSSVDSKYQADLDKGALPNDFRKEFQAKGFELSQSATVEVKEAGNRWVVRDEDYGRAYLVNRENNALNIYPPDHDPAQWVCLEETLNDKNYEKDKHDGGILGKFKENLRFTLKKHNLATRDIEHVILVGGPMCMPAVRAAIREVFADNAEIVAQLASFDSGFPVDPFEAVVKGAILRDEVDPGAIRSAYTYGFMLDGKLLESLLIPRGTPIARGSQQVTREMPPLSVRPGMLLNISLYMRIETAGGVEHWRLGDYQFAPVAQAGQGTSVQPSIALSEEEICSLKVRDLVSGKPLTLVFKDDKREEIGKPDVHHILDQKDLEEIRKSDPDLYDAIMKARQGGDFSAADVDKMCDMALSWERVVRQAINAGRQPPPDAMTRHQRLGELLKKVVRGKPIQAVSPEAKVFQEALNNLAELINILRNAGFQA